MRRLALSGVTGLALVVAGCGLSTVGLEPVGDGSPGALDAALDATTEAPPPDAAEETTVPPDATPESAPPTDGPGANTSTSCGTPGHCADCTTSQSGTACVNGGCGCNGAPTARRRMRASQIMCAAPDAAVRASHRAAGAVAAWGRASPSTTITAAGHACRAAARPRRAAPTARATATAEARATARARPRAARPAPALPWATRPAAILARHASTAPDSPSGSNCEFIAPNSVCGCDGPPSSAQCPTGNACLNMKCTTACDGQHPCNGGCCSGNDNATSTCLAVCPSTLKCTNNYCH